MRIHSQHGTAAPLERCDMWIGDAFEEGLPVTREQSWGIINRKLNLLADASRVLLGHATCDVITLRTQLANSPIVTRIFATSISPELSSIHHPSLLAMRSGSG